MVNAPSSSVATDQPAPARPGATHAPALGAASRNPFGDLATLQHLSVRLAKALKGVFESHYRGEVGCAAEPIVIQRFSDYRAERGDGLSTHHGLAIVGTRHRARLICDGQLILEMLDCFFGGAGDVPMPLPVSLSPAAAMLGDRLAASVAPLLDAAWEPLARITFAPDPQPATAHEPAADEAMVVARFIVTPAGGTAHHCDILYPAQAVKSLCTAPGDQAEPAPAAEPQWRAGLTRAVMRVPLPVRVVLAEPTVPLATLLDLKPGDVIPLEFGAEAPVMVAQRRLGTGEIGATRGRAAVRLTSLEPLTEEDFR
ncbi:FliM/FliN family flagellar motor switch protein [Sphingomonas sp. RS6]